MLDGASIARGWWSCPTIMAFGIAFVATLFVGLLQGARPFYGDSGEYWVLANSFARSGHLSLLSFASPLRGYAWPLAIHLARAFAEGVGLSQWSTATLINVLLYAAIGAVLAPRLAEIAWPGRRWPLWRRLALVGLLLIFWSGDLNYPLTDVPGLTMALLALVAVAQLDSPAWMLVAGLAGGVAVDMRPAFLPLIPMLAIIVGWTWFEQRGSSHASLGLRMLCGGLLVLGFAAASLPQSLATHRYYNSWSFVPGTVVNLEATKLSEGMVDERFDSYFGPDGPGPLLYPDEAGRRLLEEQPGGKIDSTGQYLGLIVTHPLTMFPLFARHLVEGLDMRYSTIYVENYDGGGHIWLRLGGFLLVFLALARILWPSARRRLGPARWRYAVALGCCSLTAVTTDVETRYMLPVCLLGYVIVLAPDWPNPIGPVEAGWRRLRTPAILVGAYLVFMAVVWHVASAAVGHLA
jgi:hypothetical protein